MDDKTHRLWEVAPYVWVDPASVTSVAVTNIPKIEDDEPQRYRATISLQNDSWTWTFDDREHAESMARTMVEKVNR